MSMTAVSQKRTFSTSFAGAGDIASGTQTHTAGNLLVAFFYTNGSPGGTGPSGVTDLGGNTWHQLTSINNGKTIDIWYTWNIAGHVNNVVTGTGFAFLGGLYGVTVLEFSGSGANDPIKDMSFGFGATATYQAHHTLKVGSANSLIVNFLVGDGGTYTGSAGYTATQYNTILLDEYKAVSSTEQPSVTTDGTASGYYITISFDGSAAAWNGTDFPSPRLGAKLLEQGLIDNYVDTGASSTLVGSYRSESFSLLDLFGSAGGDDPPVKVSSVFGSHAGLRYAPTHDRFGCANLSSSSTWNDVRGCFTLLKTLGLFPADLAPANNSGGGALFASVVNDANLQLNPNTFPRETQTYLGHAASCGASGIPRITCFENGVNVGTALAKRTAISVAGIQTSKFQPFRSVWSQPASGQMYADCGGFLLFHTPLTDTEVAEVQAYFTTIAGSIPASPNLPVILFVGDSITDGYATGAQSWPALIMQSQPALKADWANMGNFGHGASTLLNGTDYINVIPSINAAVARGAPYVLVNLFLGTNDLSGATAPATVLGYLEAAADAWKALGTTATPVYVHAITPIARNSTYNDTAFESARQTLMTGIMASSHFDKAYNAGAQTGWGAGGTADASGANYEDGTHPNTVGEGVMATMFTPVTTLTPQTVIVATPGSGKVTLTWTLAATLSPTSQKVYRGTSSGTETLLHTISDGTTTSYDDSTGTPGTTYFFTVTSVNSFGESAQSAEVHAAPNSSGPAPDAPTGLSASATADAQLTLTWVSVSGATSYSVFRGTTPGGESGTAIATGVTGTTYVDTGLPAATLYDYVVKAVGTGGTSAASNEASATTTNLPRPTNLAFGAGALGAKTFQWDAVTYGSDTITYVVKRRRAGVLTTLSASQSENTYTIAVVDQVNNDTYLVAAKNGSGAVSPFASKIFNPTDEEIMIPIDSASVSVPTGSAWTTLQDVSTEALKVQEISFDATAPADADVELQVCVRAGASGQIVTIVETIQMVHSLLSGNHPVPRGTTSSFACRVPAACDSVLIRGRHNASSTKTITTVGSLA